MFGGPEGCRRTKFETTRRHTHDSRRITGDVQQRRGPAESGEVDMIKGWYVLDDHPQDLACDCQVDLEEAYEDDWTVCNQESVVGVFCFIMLYYVVFLLISPDSRLLSTQH